MHRRWFLLASIALLVAGVAVVVPRWRPPPLASEPSSGPSGSVADTLALHPGPPLSGRVVDPFGGPIEGARVALAPSGQMNLNSRACPVCGKGLLNCSARSTVRAILESLQANTDAVVPAGTALSDRDGRFRLEPSAGTTFTLWAIKSGYGMGVVERAGPGGGVDVVLTAPRSLHGRVLDADGRPLAGAQVHAVPRALPIPISGASGKDGRFELTGLGEGPFYVLAAKQGLLSAIEPEASAGPDDLVLTLEAPRLLEVSVKQSGHSVEATVRVHGDHLDRETKTEGGVARFADLAPDEVTVLASAGTRVAGPQTVTLDEPVTRIELDLEAGGLLSLTLTDEAGQPVANPKITVSADQFSEASLYNRVASTGERVTIGPLPFGDYWISASADNFSTVERPVALRGPRVDLEWTLESVRGISGRVVDAQGRGVPDVSIMLGPVHDSATSGADGKFSFPVPSAGLYSLEAHHSDWGGGSLKTTAPASGVEVRLAQRASLSIQVTANGRPVEGAHASLSSDTLGFFRTDRPSSSQGTALLRGIPAGTYSLLVEHPQYLEAPPTSVTLKNDDSAQISVELRGGAILTGVVVDERGTPIAGASVLASYSTTGASLDASTEVEPRNVSTVSDGQGHFELKPLMPAAAIEVTVSHPRYEDATQTEVASATRGLRIVLQRKSLVRGRVVDAIGSPVKRFDVDGQSVASTDGRFELYLGTAGNTLSFGVSSPGFAAKDVEVPRGTADVGDIVLTASPRLSGVVRDERGTPIADAVVTCGTCDTSVTTGPTGEFRLAIRELDVEGASVSATKGKAVASARLNTPLPDSMVLILKPSVHLTGTAYAADGTPAAGQAISAFESTRSETVSWVTAADGTYQVDLPAGQYQIPEDWSATPTTMVYMVVSVQEPQMRLDLGPAPGAPTLTVNLTQQPSSFWLIAGDVALTTPDDLLHLALAKVVYSSQSESVQLRGLQPGPYTMAWGIDSWSGNNGHAPQTKHFDVRGSTQASLGP